MTPMRAVGVRLAFATALLSLAGCNQHSALPVQGVALQGKVHGGQQPVTGAAIYLYVAGSTGTGSASSSLLVSAPNTTKDGSGNYYATTDGNGGFTITGDYTCPSGDTQVYIVAVGGNPGLASGTNNAALTMMAPLGSCGLLKPSTFITIDEVTTVGSVAALYPDMVSYSAIGTASAATEDLANLFNVATEYINSATGLAPGPNLPSATTGRQTRLTPWPTASPRASTVPVAVRATAAPAARSSRPPRRPVALLLPTRSEP